MGNELRVGARLTADSAQFVPAIRVARRELAEFGVAARAVQTGIGQMGGGAQKLEAQLRSLGSVALGAAGLGSLTGAVVQLAQTADSFTALRSRLDLVTGSAQGTAAAYANLFETAQGARVELGGLAATYTQMARSAADAGVSQERVLAVTGTLSRAITISGGSAESAQAAMVQLSQGLASGALRGEEFNSILEQTPRVAKALADGLGVGIGELKRLGEQGRLTTEVVIGALEKAAPSIAAEFAKLTPTIGQSLTTLSNSATNLVGILDQMAGSSSAVARSIVAISSGVDKFAGAIEGNPVVLAYLEALKFAASGGPAGAAYRYVSRDRNQADAQASVQNDAIVSRRAGEIGAATARRSGALESFVGDAGNQSQAQLRAAALEKLEATFRRVMGAQEGASQSEVERLFGAYRQGIENISRKFEEKGGAAAGRAAVTDGQQARRSDAADADRGLQTSASREIRSAESQARQGLLTEEELAIERGRIQQRAVAARIALAEEERRAAGNDLSERARAVAKLNALDQERLDVTAAADNRLAKLAAERAAALEKQSTAGRLARFSEIQSAREVVQALEEEGRARRISMATGRDEVEVLKELALERAEAQLAIDEKPDPDLIERVKLLREEVRLLKERREERERGRDEQEEKRRKDPDKRKEDGEGGARGDDKSAIDELKDSIEGFGRSSSRVFAEYVVTGRSSFARVREAFVSEMVEMVAYRTIFKPLAKEASLQLGSVAQLFLSGADGGGTGVVAGDSLLSATGDAIRGRRARGGPVAAGETYWVGEEGPELLRMGAASGTVIPARKSAEMAAGAAGRGAPTFNVTINAAPGTTRQEVLNVTAEAGARLKAEILASMHNGGVFSQ